MTDAAWAFMLGAALCAVFDWAAVATLNKPVEYVAKPAAMMFLVGAAVALEPTDEAHRWFFVIALVFCLAGDVFLMLHERLFVFGLGSFLVGHLFYVGGFIAGGIDAGALPLWVLGLVLVGFWPATQVVGGAARKNPRLRIPVIAYVVVISAMVAFAGGSGEWVAMVGALLFYASDTMIGISRFVRDFPRAKLAIIVTYHLGQAGLVASLLR